MEKKEIPGKRKTGTHGKEGLQQKQPCQDGAGMRRKGKMTEDRSWITGPLSKGKEKWKEESLRMRERVGRDAADHTGFRSFRTKLSGQVSVSGTV